MVKWHYAIRTERNVLRALCHVNAWTPRLTTAEAAVTCRRCQAMLAKQAATAPAQLEPAR